MDKVVASAADAVADIGDGASLAVGGFGMSGVPTVLIAALLERGATDLETISNNLGVDGFGLGTLLGLAVFEKLAAGKQADPPGFRELDRITDQIEQDLPDMVIIPVKESLALAHHIAVEAEAFHFRPDTEHRLHRIHHGRQGEAFLGEGYLPCLDPGEIQYLVDQGQQK